MMDMLGVGDAININTNKNIRRYAKRINGVLCIYSQLSVGQYGELDESELKQQLINKHVDYSRKWMYFKY